LSRLPGHRFSLAISRNARLLHGRNSHADFHRSAGRLHNVFRLQQRNDEPVARRRDVAGDSQRRGASRLMSRCRLDQPRRGLSDLEVNAMMLPAEGYLLRIFIGESDRHDGKLLHEWIVMKAREDGLAGATVLRGMIGFGAHSRLHTFKIERLSQDLPIIVEIVDTREKLEKFLALIDNEIEEGMATLEEVRIHFYRSGQ